jgi:hypothetical protein
MACLAALLSVPSRSQQSNKFMCYRVWKLATCEPFGAALRLTAGWGRYAGGGVTVVSVLP